MTPLKENIIPASLITLSAIGIAFTLYTMKNILVPFVFSIFLYFMITPVMRWLKTKCKLPHILALLITFTFVSTLVTGFILILGISITSLINGTKMYYDNLFYFVDTLANSPVLERLGIQLDFTIIKDFLSAIPIFNWVTYLTGSVFKIISNIVLILIFLLFIAIGEKSETARQIIDDEVESKITRYIATKFFTSLLTAIITFILLLIFNIDAAFILSAATFFLNFIPNIGSILAIILTLPIIFIKLGFSLTAILLISILAGCQFIIGNVVDPKLLGENLGLHPVMILLSLLFWGYIWGIPGMFLAVPMSATIKILISRSKISHFFFKTLEKEV